MGPDYLVLGPSSAMSCEGRLRVVDGSPTSAMSFVGLHRHQQSTTMHVSVQQQVMMGWWVGINAHLGRQVSGKEELLILT